MIKAIDKTTVFYDLEYVPDVATIRRVYNIGQGVDDKGAVAIAYLNHGASAENPTPMLKTMFYRIVSMAAIVRKVSGVQADGGHAVSLSLFSLPAIVDGVPSAAEADIIARLLNFVGKNKAQMVGFANSAFDQTLLVQRAVINGISCPEFFARPDKPWEGKDYFAKFSDAVVDMCDVLSGGYGHAKPKLGDFCAAMGIPGKLGVDGGMVADMVAQGRLSEVIPYNEHDTASTYLLWLNFVHTAGLLSYARYRAECAQFREYLEGLANNASGQHWHDFLEAWA